MLHAQLLTSNSQAGTSRSDFNDAGSSSNWHQPPRANAEHLWHHESSAGRLEWNAHRVRWYKGSIIYRQYTYSENEGCIGHAIFADFTSPPSTSANARGGLQDDDGRGRSRTFGPFHTSATAKWGVPRANRTDAASSGFESRSKTRLSSIVIFLETQAHVYHPSGEHVLIHLPFKVELAWALPAPQDGILVQRGLDRRERRRLGTRSVLTGIDQTFRSVLDTADEFMEDVSPKGRLFTLSGPHEEFKEVLHGEIREIGGSLQLLESEVVEPDTSVVFNAASSPITILHKPATREILFTHQICTPPKAYPTETQFPPQPTPRTMRPADILVPDPLISHPPPARPSLQRNPSSFGTVDRRTSGLVDPLDRAQRRGPRMSRNMEVDRIASASGQGSKLGAGSGGLQKALEPTSLPSSSTMMTGSRVNKGKARISEVNKRRESAAGDIMREEMDPTGRGALQRLGDKDLAETTMLMGVEQSESERSEVVLSRIGAWSYPE